MRIFAPRARSACRPRVSLASDPDTSRAAVQQDAGDARHPGSPDAHHVHPSQLGWQFLGGHRSIPGAGLRARSNAAWATLYAASRCPTRAAAAVIAANRGGSVSSAATSLATRSRCQGRVGDQHAATGVDHRQRVEPLLAVADRQRHVDGRQSDGRDLGDRHRPGPADHQVGGGVGQVHPVQVRHRHIGRFAGLGRAQLEGVLGSVGVQHGHTGGGQVGGRTRDGTVEGDRTLRTAEHQQHPRVLERTRSAPALRPATPRGPAPVIAARTGTPTTSAPRSPESGTAARIRFAVRAPTRLASPALALASWISTGIRRAPGHAAAAR